MTAPGDAVAVAAERRAGLLAGAAAYGLWGLFPLYFHLLDDVSPVEVLCHRVLWTLVTMAVFLRLRDERGWPSLLRDGRRTAAIAAAAVLIGVNWLVYVWAVDAERVVEASLGYFICPLITVVLGVGVLREHLRRLQGIAAALGAVAVVVLTVAYGHVPWVALTLACTFAAYGFTKKRLDAPAATSLAAEALVLAPAALVTMVVLGADGSAAFGRSGWSTSLLLAGTGVVTAVPLALFAASATRIPLTLVGLLQYITPTLQFVIGVVVFGEAMSGAQWAGFAIVWVALALLSLDALATEGRSHGARLLNRSP